MRMIDRLMEDKKKLERKNQPNPNDEPDEMEIMMELPASESINAAASVFDRGLEARFGGINTAPSVFDRQAVFRVRPTGEAEKE